MNCSKCGRGYRPMELGWKRIHYQITSLLAVEADCPEDIDAVTFCPRHAEQFKTLMEIGLVEEQK